MRTADIIESLGRSIGVRAQSYPGVDVYLMATPSSWSRLTAVLRRGELLVMMAALAFGTALLRVERRRRLAATMSTPAETAAMSVAAAAALSARLSDQLAQLTELSRARSPGPQPLPPTQAPSMQVPPPPPPQPPPTPPPLPPAFSAREQSGSGPGDSFRYAGGVALSPPGRQTGPAATRESGNGPPSDGGGGLAGALAQIRSGAVKLRHVDRDVDRTTSDSGAASTPAASPDGGQGESIAAVLRRTLAGRKAALESDDDDCPDDWNPG